MFLTVAEQVGVLIKIADVSGDAGQLARPIKADTEAGPSSALLVICTVGPGLRLVSICRPLRLERALLPEILIRPGEHCRRERLPKKLGRAVPVTMRELGCTEAELKFQNLVSPLRPGKPRRAGGPVGATLGSAPEQFWHSWMTSAPTCFSERKKTGAKGYGRGNGVWSTLIVNALLMTCAWDSPSLLSQRSTLDDT